MEVATTSRSRCHLVAVPYPGRGHINPMMNFCMSLISRIQIDVEILITVVVTEEWAGFLSSEVNAAASIRFAAIPNVLPSELVRGADFPGFVEATQTKMEDPVEQLLDRMDLSVTAIVADVCLPWVLNVANHRNIPVASLWIMSASSFSIGFHRELLTQKYSFPIQLSEQGEEIVDHIPGVPPFRLADLPSSLHENAPKLPQSWKNMFIDLHKTQYILIASIYELESSVIDVLKQKISVPLYAIGPLIPPILGENTQLKTPTHSEFEHYMKWLDSQPKGSVLYVSMGSFLSVSSAQMDEIAAGLSNSGVRYLWVARKEASRLKDNGGGSRSGGENEMRTGMVVPWCDQLRVLCHPSVGGFWSHCGWNSTQEALFAGVPLLTFPIFMDQFPNSKLIVDDWKIGWRVKTKMGSENLVNRDDIAEIVKKFINLESDERKEMTRRAKELQEICRRQLGEDGPFQRSINALVKEILQL